MKSYCVKYQEVSVYDIEVEAEDFNAAEAAFDRLADEGKIDFSEGWFEDGQITEIICEDGNIRETKTMSFSDMERMVNILKAYVANDAVGICESSILYDQLVEAGATDEDIELLGFGYCLPEETD